MLSGFSTECGVVRKGVLSVLRDLGERERERERERGLPRGLGVGIRIAGAD